MASSFNNFFETLENKSQNTAVIDETGGSLSYRQLAVKSALFVKSTKPRTLAFCLCSNSLEFVTSYLGLLRQQVVPLLLSASVDASMLSNLITLYRPQYLFLPKSRTDLKLSGRLLSEGASTALIELTENQIESIHPDLALLLPTSGSTGSPKFVRLSLKNILSNAQSILDYLPMNESDRAITTMPMNYSYGLSILHSHLSCGASLLLTNASMMEKRFWSFFLNQSATTFGGVPYTYSILKRLGFEKMDLPSLRYFTQAGGKLSDALASTFLTEAEKRKIQFFMMYGQTEATARMAYLDPKFARSHLGSIGRAIPGGELWLVDDQDRRILEEGLTGELVYQGENVSLGYAENRFDLSKGDDNRGILHTGDLGKVSNDGFYTIVGRKNRFIKVFGHRINSSEIEAMVHEMGFDCAVSGADDEIKIYVSGAHSSTNLAQILSQRTGLHLSAFKIHEVLQIPRNENGKIQYQALETEVRHV